MAIDLPGVFFIIFKAVPITFPWLSPSFAAFQPCDEKTPRLEEARRTRNSVWTTTMAAQQQAVNGHRKKLTWLRDIRIYPSYIAIMLYVYTASTPKKVE